MYRDMATMDQGPGYLNGVLVAVVELGEPESELH